LTAPDSTIDSIAKAMFKEGPHRNMPLSLKRAVLLHNNPELMAYLDKQQVPANLLVDITPLHLSKFDKGHWRMERLSYESYLRQMAPMTREMFQKVGPEDTYILSRLVEALKEQGASVGPEDIVRGLGYGAAGVSGLCASAQMSVAGIDGLMQQMAADVMETFGSKLALSKKAAHLAKIGRHLQSHPNYPQLVRQVRELPELLLPVPRHKLVPLAAGDVDAMALARRFRKGHYQAFRHWPSGKYMGPITQQLNGRIGFFKAMGRHATWYVPTVIGLYNVYEAPQEVKMRTLFEEGFGVVGGALGTKAGVAAGLAIVAILGLGPLGLFITVFFCATVGGITGNELFKKGADRLYEWGVGPDSMQIYHFPEQLLEAY
jgi:hypothetical protein